MHLTGEISLYNDNIEEDIKSVAKKPRESGGPK
jgi:hypothetical protein